MADTELLKQIARDINAMKEQMVSMQEQLDRIEQGQKFFRYLLSSPNKPSVNTMKVVYAVQN